MAVVKFAAAVMDLLSGILGAVTRQPNGATVRLLAQWKETLMKLTGEA